MSDRNDPKYVQSLEEEVVRLRELARTADEQRRDALMRFAAGFSHDINNFLTPMLAYSSMIKDDLPPGHPVIDYVDEILQATEKMQQFIKLMQDVRARGKLAGVVALNPMITAAVDRFRPHLPVNIHLAVQLDSSLGDVQGDETALHRGLHELLENAVHAMPVGGDLTVETRSVVLDKETPMDGTTATPGAYAVVVVRDQGTGMGDSLRERMYDPYFTTNQLGQARGLGLALVHGVIRKCSGHIRCTSALGAGTRFEIFLQRISNDA